MKNKNVEVEQKTDWNKQTYEKYHSCDCGGSLVLTRKTGTTQEFVCGECHKNYELSLLTGRATIVSKHLVKTNFFKKGLLNPA